jgi:hypothetical protein
MVHKKNRVECAVFYGLYDTIYSTVTDFAKLRG